MNIAVNKRIVVLIGMTVCVCGILAAPGQQPANEQDNPGSPVVPPGKPTADDPVGAEDGAPELTREASKAIDRGLQYLLKIQRKDGSWDKDDGHVQVASTSLALMAFMVKGEFPGEGPNGEALDRAKDWLLEKAESAPDGYLGKSMYEHGIATLALTEMWGMTAGDKDDLKIEKAIEAAVKVILRSQNVGGGWRYQPSPTAGQDTSVTMTVFVALASARQAGILVPDKAIARVVRYLEGAQTSTGAFSYSPNGLTSTPACSAGGLYVAQLCGQRDSQMVKAAKQYLTNQPDSIFLKTNYYYYTHYYAIQAMVQSGDKEYTTWYPKIRDALISKQEEGGGWARGAGGSAVSSSMAILILGTPHRFIPIYQR